MQELPIEALRKIKNVLFKVELKDLVIVFSNAVGNDYLLVYNSKQLPAQSREKCQLLGSLAPSDYADLDSLVVGFSAIDIVLPDIPIHGVNFYAIEDVFASDDEKQEAVWQTAFRFAKTLFDHLDSLPETERRRLISRAEAKIIQLCLPTLLSEHPLQNLVAVLFEGDLRSYVERKQNCRLIYNNPEQSSDLINSLRSNPPDIQQCWMVAIEDVAQFLPECSRQLIELRIILRQLGKAEILRNTLRQLAYRFWRMSITSHNDDLKNTAYTMAAEANLMGEDVEHMVSLCPHQDFARFVETGDALRIYRTPILNQSGQLLSVGPRYSLEDLLKNRINEPDYETSPLAFSILAPVLTRFSLEHSLNLELVLWKMGKGVQLGRTLMLLSRDLLKIPSQEWLRINADPEAISDMALRAVLIHGLANPWLWNIRYKYNLRRYYEHLSNSLRYQKAQAKDSLEAAYVEALWGWYGSYTTDDQTSNLQTILNACRTFLESGRMHSKEDEREQSIRNLRAISESLIVRRNQAIVLHHHTTDSQPQPFGVANYLRTVVDHHSSMKPLSDPFQQHFQEYQSIHAEWRGIQEQVKTQRPSFEKLDNLLAEYEFQQRTIFAPPHELTLLHWMLEEDIQRIKGFRQAIEIGRPIINIQLIANWVTAGIDEQLIVEVDNRGGASAHQLRVELVRSQNFDLLSEQSSFTLDTLLAGESRRLEWRIRVRDQLVSLIFKYRFQDHHSKQYSDQESIPVEVLQPRNTNIGPKGNLFQAGIPVYGWNKFFGRVDEFKKILNRLGSGINQPFLLRGPRRMGKSSILNQLKWLLEKPERRRMSEFSAENQIQLNRIRPIFTTLQEVSSAGQDYVAYFFQTIFEDICKTLELPYNEEQLSKSFAHYPARAFSKQLDAVFRERAQIRLLVLIDEWDELNREEHDRLSTNLRGVIEHEERINWIISSTWALSVESGRFGSPFFNQSLIIELKEMEWEAAVNLIRTISQQMDVVWRPEAVMAVLEHTGRRPYLIQLICSRTIDYLDKQSTNLVDANTVTVVISQFLRDAASSLPVFNFIWNDDTPLSEGRDNINELGRLILWVLNTHHPKRLSQSEIERLIKDEFNLNDLALPNQIQFNQVFNEQMILLEKIFDVINEVKYLMIKDKESDYQFSIPLQRAWFQQTVAKRRDLIERAHNELFQ